MLTANIAHYRSIFEQGQAVIDHPQYANDEQVPVATEDPNSAAERFGELPQNSKPELPGSPQSAVIVIFSLFVTTHLHIVVELHSVPYGLFSGLHDHGQ